MTSADSCSFSLQVLASSQAIAWIASGGWRLGSKTQRGRATGAGEGKTMGWCQEKELKDGTVVFFGMGSGHFEGFFGLEFIILGGLLPSITNQSLSATDSLQPGNRQPCVMPKATGA